MARHSPSLTHPLLRRVSPRPGPRRPIVGIRIKPDAITFIDKLATTEGVTRSEMIRRLLAEALAARTRKG